MRAEQFFIILANVDADLLLRADKKQKSSPAVIFKRIGMIAACFAVIISIMLPIAFMPKTYDLDYELYLSKDGENGGAKLENKNVWIYFVKGSKLEREYVKLPFSSKNVFTAWKHLNSIGEEVKLLSATFSDGQEQAKQRTNDITRSYELKEGVVLTVTVSAELSEYIKEIGELLLESLEKTMLGYSKLEYGSQKSQNEQKDTENNDTEDEECEHSYALAETTDATCTKNGSETYECTLCGDTKKESIQALGHQKKILPAKEGNCTENGLSEGEICTRCNTVLKAQQNLGKSTHNHNFVDDYCTRCLWPESIEVSKYSLAPDKKSYILTEGGFTEEIKVRETFNGLPVTDIDLAALTSLNFVERIIISNSVSQNKDSIFYGVKELKTRTVGNLKYFASDTNDYFILVKGTNENITSLKVPEGVEIIANSAFSGFQSLKTVSLPSTLKRIEIGAFEGCFALVSINIPNGTEYIGHCAFSSCKALTELKYPDSVKVIGIEAMRDCTSLHTVTLSKTLTNIEECMFFNCSSLQKITLHEGITKIGGEAFCGCISLTELSIPNSVTELEASALNSNCPLKRLSIGDGITEFKNPTKIVLASLTHLSVGASYRGGFDIFFLGENIEEITVSEKNTHYKTQSGVLFSGDGKELILFPTGKSISEYTVPSGVTTIKQYAFQGCELQKLVISDTVTRIEIRAISNCKKLKTVIMSNSIIQVDLLAFVDSAISCNVYENGNYIGSELNPYVLLIGPINNSIKTLTTHPLTRAIMTEAFDFCTSLQTVVFSNQIVGIGDRAFKQTDITSAVLPDSVTYLGEEVFGLCLDLASARLPKGITEIPNLTFSGCRKLKTVAGMHEGITRIGYKAFLNCDSLADLHIPSSVSYIGEQAFYSCNSLKLIIIPEGVTTICSGTFYLSDFVTIVIPKSVKTIEDMQFSGDYNTKLPIYYMGSADDWKKISVSASQNGPLLNSSNRYYYSEQKPTASGKYWHYVDSIPTKW